MSWYEYEESKRIGVEDPSFYALIMAAARKADSDNFARLEQAFPSTIAELQERYNAPGGFLGDES